MPLKEKQWELSRARAALESNGYPSKFIQNIQTNKTRFLTNASLGEVVGMFFQDVWTNCVTQVFCFSSLHQRCNRAFDTSPQKTSCYICKQSIDHPTATVPGPEVSTFPGFGDKRHVQNFLCQLFVVLQWRNGQFSTPKMSKQWQKALGLQIIPGLRITLLTLETLLYHW